MQLVSDLHLHSKYSRAVSPQMTLPVMATYGKQKGIDLLTTGDWTHPVWFREIRNFLTESEEGIYKIKNPTRDQEKTRFLLTVEISCIYSSGGKGRRIHNLVISPSLEVSEKINREFVKRGYNISSDGRPIIGMPSKNLLQLILEIDERCLLIPCHIWTPWFGIYGKMSGYNSLEECFEELSPYVYGIETGLSSDPEMNWQIKELDTRSILSFSDAHSPAKMGREATVFALKELSYTALREAIMAESLRARGKNAENHVLYTIEFYPEEGKYHYSGHRNCHVTMTPEEQSTAKGVCPVCKKPVTDGVMRRVKELANENPRVKIITNEREVQWFTDPKDQHPPFVKIVPLLEIIAEAIGRPVASPKVLVIFEQLVTKLESELFVLLKAPMEGIKDIAGERVAEGVMKVRHGSIVIQPGFDGVYGTVKIWNEEKSTSASHNQLGLAL